LGPKIALFEGGGKILDCTPPKALATADDKGIVPCSDQEPDGEPRRRLGKPAVGFGGRVGYGSSVIESTFPASRRAPCPPPASDPRWALAVAVLGSSMAFLDGTVVNVALPVMQRELGIAVDTAQWIVEAYALLLASLVLVGGALGDRFGRRRVFVTGVVIFAVASVGCGLAPGAPLLILARGVQGVGGALLVPGSLALISAAYPDSDARGAAIGTWSAWSAVTAAVGPVTGGWVVSHASWRWLFFFNVPVACTVVTLGMRRVGESRDEAAAAEIDVLGASLVTVGLGLVVYALIDSERDGIGSTRVATLLAAGAAALVAFVRVESKRAAPMVSLALFRSRTFSGANLLTLLLYAALGGALFFLPFNLIQVQGYAPAMAGAALLPFVLLVSALSRRAGLLAGRYGARWPLVVGPLVAGGGFALLAVPGVGGDYWSTFFPGILGLGFGMGATVAPLTAAVMGSVDPRHAGVASGINNAVARTAALLAIAALGVVLRGRFSRVLDAELRDLSLPAHVAGAIDAQRSRLGGAEFPAELDIGLQTALRRAFSDAFVAGFRAVMIVCAALAVLGALAAFVLVDRHVTHDGREGPGARERQTARGGAS
jgi:EmrB/QacA subfamily drug resistance transporter